MLTGSNSAGRMLRLSSKRVQSRHHTSCAKQSLYVVRFHGNDLQHLLKAKHLSPWQRTHCNHTFAVVQNLRPELVLRQRLAVADDQQVPAHVRNRTPLLTWREYAEPKTSEPVLANATNRPRRAGLQYSRDTSAHRRDNKEQKHALTAKR